jgi:hypothetical protein
MYDISMAKKKSAFLGRSGGRMSHTSTPQALTQVAGYYCGVSYLCKLANTGMLALAAEAAKTRFTL